jgi:DNA-binding transcriptional regulator YdaS (Cro superfamily)
MDRSGVEAAVEAAGGVRPLGRLLGISHQAIVQWDEIPAGRLLEIERLTGVPRETLRPDLYRRQRERA